MGRATVRRRVEVDSGARHQRRAAPGVELAEERAFVDEKVLFSEVEDVVGFFNGMKTHVSQHYQILYVLCVLVHSQGHFKTIDDMPIWGGAHPPALVAYV